MEKQSLRHKVLLVLLPFPQENWLKILSKSSRMIKANVLFHLLIKIQFISLIWDSKLWWKRTVFELERDTALNPNSFTCLPVWPWVSFFPTLSLSILTYTYKRSRTNIIETLLCAEHYANHFTSLSHLKPLRYILLAIISWFLQKQKKKANLRNF